jgi:membrane protein required for colicin V production
MNYLDVLIAVPIIWGIYKGWQQGIIFEVATLIGLILGFYLAFKFSSLFESLVGKFVTGSSNVLPYVTFFIVLISVILVMILLAKFLEGVLKITNLTPINKVAGAVSGGLKLALTMSIILSLIRPVDAQLNMISAKTKSESKLYAPVLNIAHYLFPAPQDVREEFSKRVK